MHRRRASLRRPGPGPLPAAVLAALAALAAPACRTAAGSGTLDVVQQAADTLPPLLVCPGGAELDSFVFTHVPATALPPGLPPAGHQPPPISRVSSTVGLRLEVCVTGDDAVLARVVLRHGGLYDVISVPAGAAVSGLNAAVFDQSYTALSVKVPFGTLQTPGDPAARPSADGLLIVGVKGDATTGGDYAVATYTRDENGATFLSPDLANRIVPGRLAFGDFPENLCAGGSPSTGRFTLGTAEFQWTGCQFLGTSGGIAPDLRQIVVTDAAPQLPADVRGKPVTVTLTPGPQGNYLELSNHHSVCDSFRLTLPQATYTATASLKGFGGGSCAGVVDLAPAPGDGGVRFRFKYPTGDWVSGEREAACWHFTRRCPPRP